MHAYNGCEHTLVVLDDGRVVSFGYNYRGQLGHGNTASEPVPKLIRGLDEMRVTQASCSYYHTVIACDNGEVRRPIGFAMVVSTSRAATTNHVRVRHGGAPEIDCFPRHCMLDHT